MNAIDTLTLEINKIDIAMAECVNEEGYVKTSCRYKYQILMNEKNHMVQSRKWLKGNTSIGYHVSNITTKEILK